VDNNLVFVLLVLLLAVIITIAILPSVRRRQRERDEAGYTSQFGGFAEEEGEESRKAQVALEELKRLERLDLHGPGEEARPTRDFTVATAGDDDFLRPGTLGPTVIRGHVADEPPLPRRPEEPIAAHAFELREERAPEAVNGRLSGAGANGVAARQAEGRPNFDWKAAAQYERSRSRGASVFDDPAAARGTAGEPAESQESPVHAAQAGAPPSTPTAQQPPPRFPPPPGQPRTPPPRVPPPSGQPRPGQPRAAPPPPPRVLPQRQPPPGQPRVPPPPPRPAPQGTRPGQSPVPPPPAGVNEPAQAHRVAAPPAPPGPAPAQTAQTAPAAPQPAAPAAPGRVDVPSESAPPPLSPPLFTATEADEFRDRWISIKGAFPDDPHAAVRQARELLDEFNGLISERLAVDKGEDGDPSTEDLRIALRRYRAFFDRLLMA